MIRSGANLNGWSVGPVSVPKFHGLVGATARFATEMERFPIPDWATLVVCLVSAPEFLGLFKGFAKSVVAGGCARANYLNQ
jgi:hypothetical protein